MNYTPAIQQYIDIKEQYSDCVLFFRLGDFYELFFDDAKLVHKTLDLVLTSKNKNSPNPVPMAGVPYHSAEKYINRLIELGHKVAIAEQISDPKPGQIVQREVVAVVTPATNITESDAKNFAYILSITYKTFKNGENYHISWGDFSLGEYHTKSFENVADMQNFIFSINPVEIILDVDLPNKSILRDELKKKIKTVISVEEVPFDAENYVLGQCKIQTLSSFGQALESGRLNAFALLLNYLKNTQKHNLDNIVRVLFHSSQNRVLVDDITIKNLEIFYSNYENLEKYSLIGVLDNSKTSAGARLFRQLLANPTNNKTILQKRVSNIEYYINKSQETKEIHKLLGEVLDIQKIVSSILYKKLSPMVFAKLRYVLQIFFANDLLISEMQRLGLESGKISKIQSIFELLKKALKDSEYIKNDVDFIADNFDAEVDRLRKIAYHSDELLMEYQKELSELSKVNNVKLKYVINQGYFIEITNKDIELFESNLASSYNNDFEKFNMIRRNTLKGSQRYGSEFLEKIQDKIIEAKESLIKQEFLVLDQIKSKIIETVHDFNSFATCVAYLDFYSSHAIFAEENKLVKPSYQADGEYALEIQEGRHLVVEKYLENNQEFIPNNLSLDNFENGNGFVHIITGPNMGGKSTYLRQNALIVLMAHCGFFVPALSAKIPLIDGIFARIGSGDIIAKNQSTFMTEMVEVANILNNATKNSFIIFDELGRGTSTYDGLALTKAILEYVVQEIQAKTLIATHYHELISLEEKYPFVKNHSVSVYETDSDVVFMKKIVKGGANKSYGLDVAKLAGIPNIILQRAEQHLKRLHDNSNVPIKEDFQDLFQTSRFAKVEDPKYEKIKSLIKSFDIDNMTPLQALQLLSKIKGELGQ